MSYEQLKNMAEDTEILTADDEKLRQMLGGLKKVKAPANFDFQLKARIANAERNPSPRPFLLPSLRLVLPLSVIVLLAGFIIFNLSLTSGNQGADVAVVNTPKIQNETGAPAPETVSTPILSTPVINETTTANLPANKIEVKNSAPEIAVVNNKTTANKESIIMVKNSSVVRNNKLENSNNDFGGTRQGASRAPEVLTQGNSNTNFGVKKPVEVVQNKISLREILSQIGIEGDFAASGWKILSVKENSSAMRAGLQAGDLIEAIDDKKLSSDTDFTQNFSVKVFRILREGKQQVVDLTTKK